MSRVGARSGARSAAEVAVEAVRHLEWLAESGVLDVPRPPSRPKPALRARPVPAARTESPAGPSSTPAPASPASGATYQLSDRGCGSPELLKVREDLGPCQRCKLAGGRTNLVFGVGDPHAELMFVGEGPGADEDAQGEPFVGAAGQLLTKMIEAMGLSRQDVYIANVVKCRPPGNRNPEPDEIEACEPFLRAQIEAVNPRFLVTLGKFAAQTLLRDPTPISRLRGAWRTYAGVQLMPTFHPAYLLRSPGEKRKAWDDLQLVMKAMGRDSSGKR